MREINDPLAVAGGTRAPHYEAAITSLDIDLTRLGLWMSHPHLVAVTQVCDPRLGLSGNPRQSPPARDQQVIKERIEDAFEVGEGVRKPCR
jgi:hypothetical protein